MPGRKSRECLRYSPPCFIPLCFVYPIAAFRRWSPGAGVPRWRLLLRGAPRRPGVDWRFQAGGLACSIIVILSVFCVGHLMASLTISDCTPLLLYHSYIRVLVALVCIVSFGICVWCRVFDILTVAPRSWISGASQAGIRADCL